MSAQHEVLPYATGIIQDYGNCFPEYIANLVSPKVKIDRRNFVYREFNKVLPYNQPPSGITGQYSQVVEINSNPSVLVPNLAVDYFWENPIGWDDFSESGQPCSALDTDITARHGQYLLHKALLARELRVVTPVTTVANYPVDNQHDQSGAVIGDGTGGTVDPLDMISEVLQDAVVQPNAIFMSKRVFEVIRRQNSIMGSTFARGRATPEMFGSIFGFTTVGIGGSWVNDTGTGLKVPVWPDDKIVLGYVDQTIDNPLCPRATFSFSASIDGDNILKAWEDPEIGGRGGVRVRVGEGIKELFFYDQGHIIHNFALSA